MKKLLLILIVALALPMAAFAQGVTLSAALSGASEVPGPGDTDGAGLAVVTIDGTTVNYTLLVQGIAAPTMAHIHTGVAGVAGGIVINFNPTFVGGVASGSVTSVDSAVINAILGAPAAFYVNVHNADFPAGAIRGQLAGAEHGGASTLFVPAIGKVAGAAGTNFVTDLRIINQSGATATVTLDFFGATPKTAQVTVAPGEQKVLNDVAGTPLAASGLGGLRITSDHDVQATARIINDLRAEGQGTTGFAFDARPLDEASQTGALSFLSNAGNISAGTGFRTNIGWFNPSSTAATITLVAHDTATGAVIGTATANVAANTQAQQNVAGLIAAANREDFYITWTSTSPVFVYAAVVDNKTGDSVVIE